MTQPNVLQTIHRVLVALALLVLAFHFAVYVVYAANLMAFPFDYDQGEGFELVDTLMFSRGEWPYRDVETYPFYSSNYPPVFHLMAVPFAWAFGTAYWYGRLLGFAATLVTAATIAFAVYRDGQRRTVALLAGLAFLASNIVYHVGPLMRQHMTMVMFETLAVVILAHVNETPHTARRRRSLALGLGLLIVAGYTKQLAAYTALAVLLFLFIRQPRRALVWGAAFAVTGAAVFLWMTWATGGQWVTQAILANVNEITFPQVEGLFRLWFALHGFLIVPAALLVVYELYFGRVSLYSVWFVGAALLGGVSSGTWGGGDSYFATSIAALCILSGIFASRTLNRAWTFPDNYLSRIFIHPLRRAAPAFAAVGLIVIPLLYLGYGRAVLHMPTSGAVFATLADMLDLHPNALNGFYDSAGRIAGGYADIGHLTTQADIDAGWRIVQMVRETEGAVLSEEAAFTLLAGRDVVTNPTQLLNLWRRGRYDGSGLIQMIEDRAFGLIILRAQFYPVPVLQAIDRHYMQVETVQMNGFDYIIKRPRPDEP